MSILVLGSVALDSVKTPFGEVTDALGGSASFFSLAARHFAPVRLLGVVGNDFPAKFSAVLKKKNIDTRGLQVYGGKTFRWCGHYGDNLNEAKTVSVCSDILSNFEPVVPPVYRNSEYVFLANTDPEAQMTALKQVKSPRLVVCDTMNLWIDGKPAALKKLLKKVDILLLNEGEAKALSGEKLVVRAALKIMAMGVKKGVLVKKGEHGALLLTGRGFFAVPAYPLKKVLDPTGAGDSFGGGFMGYLASRRSVSEEALRKAAAYGTVTASFACEAFSTKRLETLTRRDIEKRLRELRKIVRF